jgi:hypothetical protein
MRKSELLIGQDSDSILEITANFRSRAPILDFASAMPAISPFSLLPAPVFGAMSAPASQGLLVFVAFASARISVTRGVGVQQNRRNEPRHRENSPMNPGTRCGARTRSGKPCRSPAVHGKTRCRMHGGALGSGARPGNRSALKHGSYNYTAKAVAERRFLRNILARSRKQLADLER